MRCLTVTELGLQGLKLVERQIVVDERGFIARLFCAEELRTAGWDRPIAQVNHAFTATRGTVRGLHFQSPPHAEMKLVSCLQGRVWDVVVDLRAGSETFLEWHAEELSADNRRALLVPEGFAHGFQALTDDVELLYCHSIGFCRDAQGGVHPRDPQLAIPWPLEITVLSAADSGRPPLDRDYRGLET